MFFRFSGNGGNFPLLIITAEDKRLEENQEIITAKCMMEILENR